MLIKSHEPVSLGAGRAVAGEGVLAVDAPSAVVARVRLALVDLAFAVSSRVSRLARAHEAAKTLVWFLFGANLIS